MAGSILLRRPGGGGAPRGQGGGQPLETLGAPPEPRMVVLVADGAFRVCLLPILMLLYAEIC